MTEGERQVKEHDQRTDMILKLVSCVKKNPDSQELTDKAKLLV